MIILENKNGQLIEELQSQSLADITTPTAQNKLQQAYLYSHVFQCDCGVRCFVRKRGDLYYTAKFPNQHDHKPGCELNRAQPGIVDEQNICHLTDSISIELTRNDIETKRAESKLRRLIGNLFNGVSGANLDKPSTLQKHKFSVKKRAESFQICGKQLANFLFLDWLPTEKQIKYFGHLNKISDYCQALAIIRVNVTTYSDEVILKSKQHSIRLDASIVSHNNIEQGHAIAAIYYGYNHGAFEPIFCLLMHAIDEYSLLPAFTLEEKSLLRSIRNFKANSSEVPARIYRTYFLAMGRFVSSSLIVKRNHQHLIFTSAFNKEIESAAVQLGFSPIFTGLDGSDSDVLHSSINTFISSKLKHFSAPKNEGAYSS